jgi:hypothetical protein
MSTLSKKASSSPSETASSTKSSSILTPENKQNEEFQNRLARLTRSDAHHDLKKVFSDTSYQNKNIRTAFDSGIPKPASEYYHEDEAFASILISAKDSNSNVIEINGKKDNLPSALSNVPDCTNSKDVIPSTFTVGMPGTPFFDFNVVKFAMKCSTNAVAKDNTLSPCEINFGKTFVTNTKLGGDGNQAAIIVDFSQHGFVEKLTEGEPHDNFKINYLMTPEGVNDPAGKPNVTNKTLFGLTTGVKLISYVEESNDVTNYTKFDESDPNPANNFFSNYDFTLSPLNKIITIKTAEKLVTTLNIKYDNPNGKPLTNTIEDSKGENSNKTVMSYLTKLIQKIMDKNDKETSFNFNSKIQQKRGGDWFQALACINARNRTFKEILPAQLNNVPNNKTIKLESTCPVYFVTHDRIAVTFALLNGINVIYLDYYGRIFVFKNSNDPTVKGSGKPMEQILFEGIQAKWFGQSNRGQGTVSVGAGELSQIITTAKRYTTDRNKYLFGERKETVTSTTIGKIESFYVKCNQIKQDLSDVNFVSSKDGQSQIAAFQKKYTEQLRKLFTAAVELTFININLINVEKDIKYVEENQNIFTGNYAEGKKEQVAQFSKALNNIKGVQDKFGYIEKTADFYTAFDNWINGNIKKLDVYKCANKILEIQASDEENIFDFQRIITFFTKEPPPQEGGIRKTDAHIFLPFIQDIDIIVDDDGLPMKKNDIFLDHSFLDQDKKTTCRARMISLLQSIVPKIENYHNTDKGINKIMRRGLHSNIIYYNNLSNLVYESFIFIDDGSSRTSSAASSAASTPPSSEPSSPVPSKLEHKYSTDNKLLDSDFKELEMMKEGKYSNFTGNTGGSGKNDPDISVDSPEPLDATENAESDIEGNVNISEETGSKVYNLRCTVTGKTINCEGARLEKEGGETVLGGGLTQDGGKSYISQYGTVADRKTKGIGIESVICDISLKQVNWPLISAILIEKTSIDSLKNFQEQIKQYIVLDTTDATDVGIDERGEREIELLKEIEEKIPEASKENLDQMAATLGTTAGKLKEIWENASDTDSWGGGAINDSSGTPIVSKDLMTDFNLGFHPLTPIYAMLSSYYNIIGPKSQSDPFFYTHFTYVNVLEKMKKVLEENYLSNTLNSPKTASAYMIGFGLYFMLFASHTSTLQNDTILQVLNMTQNEYFEFSLKNNGFGSVFLGSVNQTPEDEVIGMVLINNKLFKNFVNNEVNIKQILQQGTPVENLPDYTVLQDRMFNLMGEIVVKVNADRGTPIGAAASASASGVEPVTGIASGIPGLSVEERAARTARGQQKYEESLARGIVPKKTGQQDTSKLFTYSEGQPGNVVTSTTSSSIGRRGGKRSKRYINKKRKITKRKKGGKTNRNKTLKKAKVYRKTRKH